MAVLKADPEDRRKFLVVYTVLVVLGAVLGIALLKWGIPALEEYLKGKKPLEALRVLQWLLVVLLLPIFPMAFYIYRYARRILTSSQYPPPGTKVIRDTQTMEGRSARRSAYIMMVLSIALVTVLILSFYIVYMLGNLIGKDSMSKEVPRVSQKKGRAGNSIYV